MILRELYGDLTRGVKKSREMELIYSSVEDNWKRVVILHSVAQDYYESTRGSDFRNRVLSGTGSIFPFDVSQFESMEKESCIVGMIMVWSVVTLESLVNHAIAGTLKNKSEAERAIEYPSRVTDERKIGKSAKSELAKKVVILGYGDAEVSSQIKLADKLADIRNRVIHDKPFSYIDHCEGDVKIEYFKLRGEAPRINRFEDLRKHYEDCDVVKGYIVSKASPEILGNSELNFGALMSP